MQKHTRWLLAEIERWVAEGIVSPEQAGRLRSRYTAREAGPPWGLIVFATAGAMVIGLGVILLFAYNWAAIPKFGKLALVFGAIIAAHACAVRLLAGDSWKPKLGEAIAALGTMLYGAGIWLVAQIYNIDEHFPNGFLFWALGALAMAWAIRSTANGLMAVVLLVFWASYETFEFHAPHYAAVLLIAIGLLPLAWKQRSAVLLAATVIAIQFLIAANVASWGGAGHAFTSSLALGVLLVAAGRMMADARVDFAGGAGVLTTLGFGAFLVCAYILSFDNSAGRLLDLARGVRPDRMTASIFTWTLSVAAIGTWAWLADRSLLKRKLEINREEWLLPVMLLQCVVFAALGSRDWALLIAWSFNLVLLGIAAMWMWRGCSESRLRPTVLGSLLLAAVVLARYFDLFDNFASRGLGFIILGGIFIAEALYYRKIKRETEGAP
ncbi:MAG TPA: DUF2157 domain-containing protein [Opitutaceae bacterium]|nr:DUF2157 domain-containing protein [Opitutaceae bacterium]